MNNHVRKIIVTGGAGTLGSQIVKKLLDKKWIEKILVLSRDEAKHEALLRHLEEKHPQSKKRVECRVCDVRDLEALIDIFQGYDGIIHAAALKRVTNGENSPEQYIATNVVGTSNVLKACRYSNIKFGVFISTDKAVAPVNLYGCTKQLGEKMWQNFQRNYPDRKFSIVRYGNVIGSSGSVLDLWSKQPAKDHKVNGVVTRFWIPVEMAADLCDFALHKMIGGEVFIEPNMAMALTDLYESIYGTEHKPEYYENLAPGEKHHECLLDANESGNLFKLNDLFIHIPQQFTDAEKYWKKEGGVRKSSLTYKLNSFEYEGKDDLSS